MNVPIFPKAASTVAEQTDHLYFSLLSFSAVMILLVFLPMFFCLYKYRRGNQVDRTQIRLPTNAIEITWTVIPILIALIFFTCGATVYFDEEVPPADVLEMNVVGKQWMWKVQHPEGNREINELHLPVNRAIKLTLASEDVIHSFYVPAFRIKQDVVPGRFTTEWFKPTSVGSYHFYCSEYCGMNHSKMDGTVIVMAPADFEDWLAHGRVAGTLAQSGEILFRTLGCSGCHSPNHAVHAPVMEGLYGNLVPLSDGTFVRADEKYLRDSILIPSSQLVAGYPKSMPAYGGHIREEEVFQLVAYIKSLAKATPPAIP